jgi:hypothetical protein
MCIGEASPSSGNSMCKARKGKSTCLTGVTVNSGQGNKMAACTAEQVLPALRRVTVATGWGVSSKQCLQGQWRWIKEGRVLLRDLYSLFTCLSHELDCGVLEESHHA